MLKGKSAISPGEKAERNPQSLKMAIAAFCYHDCVGETRKNAHESKYFIGQCANQACHLWPHRPWQNSTGGNLREIRQASTQNTPLL